MKSRGIVVLAGVLLAIGVVLAMQTYAADNPPKVSFFRVMAATAKNDDTGRTLLTKYENVLKERKYTDVVIMPNEDKSKLCLLVGKFPPNGMIEAEGTRQKVTDEPFDGKKPFKDASVVHGM